MLRHRRDKILVRKIFLLTSRLSCWFSSCNLSNSNAHYNHKTKSCDLNLELLSIIPTITALQIIPSATSSTTTTTLLVKVTQSAALQLGVVFNTFVSEVYNVITLISKFYLTIISSLESNSTLCASSWSIEAKTN